MRNSIGLGKSTVTSEVVVEAVQRNAQGRRSPVNTSPRVGDSTHIVQKATHFGKRKRLVGFHGPSARIHESDVVLFRFNGLKRPTVEGKVLEEVEEKRLHFLARKQLR